MFNALSALNDRPLSHMSHILVVDDDDRIRTLLLRYLRENDFVTVTACDAEQAQEMINHFVFDLVVLDVMMPRIDGFAFARRLRDAGEDIPILFLTARVEAQDRIEGLEIGADDYLLKPFEPRELVLRIQSILRRKGAEPEEIDEALHFGPWVFHPQYDEIAKGDARVALTTAETSLLRALARKMGQVVSREELSEVGCGDDNMNERTIDVQVNRLRKKIELDPKQPRYLRTVRGAGYMLRSD